MNKYGWKENSLAAALLMAVILPVAAKDIYKARGADGSLIFSDKPIPGGERLHIKDIPTVSMPKAHKGGAISYPIKSPGLQSSSIARYEKLLIKSPANDSTLDNQTGELTVELSLTPPLQTNHKFKLILDNKPIDPPTAKSSFRLNNLDRGDHRLQGQVVDKDGLPVISSEVFTVHVHRPSIDTKEPNLGSLPQKENTPEKAEEKAPETNKPANQ